MEEQVDIIRQASCALDAVLLASLAAAGLGAAGLGAATDESVCLFAVELEALGRRVDALRVAVAGEIGERSRIELGADGLAYKLGCTKADHLLEQLTLISSADAAKRLRIARATRPRCALDGTPSPALYPVVGARLAAGSIPVDSADVVIRCLSQAERTADPVWLADAETSLVDTATRDSVGLVAVAARVWREALDPDGAVPRDEQLREKRAVTLGRNVNGMTALTGWLDPTSEALLRSLFTEGTGPGRKPRFLALNPAGAATPDTSGDATPLVEADLRTRAQRQHDILFGVLTAGIRSTETPGSMRALTTINIVVSAENFDTSAGAAWIDTSDEPISAVHTKELACDAVMRRIRLGPDGEVLHLGHPTRLFSSQQRKALAIRDGGCVWPTCTAPPSWCHAHHVTEWHTGGLTDIDNGVLLCAAHHHMLHNSDYRFTMPGGVPYLTAPAYIDPTQTPRRVGRQRAIVGRRKR